MSHLLALEFPPTSHLIEWPAIWGTGWYAINKVVILLGLSIVIAGVFFIVASRPKKLVPTGSQNFAESIVDFIRNDVIMQTMGPEGLWWTPFLFTLFVFVFMCNIWEIIPIAQMPVNSRIAIPVFLALMVWFLYIVVGIKHQGPWGYWKNSIFPPGVPWPMYFLLTPIELLTVLIIRPLSLSVRLFANMLAGHLLLVSFAVLTSALFVAPVYIFAALPFALLVALTGFELLVAVLQAFIFTILTAVYLGSSLHPEH